MRPDEIRVIEGIAAHAGTAIVNARLYARAAQEAIDAERVRVYNLLHDTLRRTLFSIGLRIEQCLHQPLRGPALRASLRRIKRDVSLMMTQINDVIPADVSPSTGQTA